MGRHFSLGTLVNSTLAPLGVRLQRVTADAGPIYREPYPLGPDTPDGMERETRKVLNLLGYTKSSGSQYAAKAHPAGYHTITLDGQTFAGQRKPAERLAGLPLDFAGATVLDLGCNQGGMLFEIADRISHGIGIDYDSRMINAANRVRAHKGQSNLDFYVLDLEREDLRILDSLVIGERVDIVMLLSVCMWIRNWRDVIEKGRRLADTMLFEANGSPEQQNGQIQFLGQCYRTVETVRHSSPDDPIQQARSLHVCRDPR